MKTRNLLFSHLKLPQHSVEEGRIYETGKEMNKHETFYLRTNLQEPTEKPEQMFG